MTSPSPSPQGSPKEDSNEPPSLTRREFDISELEPRDDLQAAEEGPEGHPPKWLKSAYKTVEAVVVLETFCKWVGDIFIFIFRHR